MYRRHGEPLPHHLANTTHAHLIPNLFLSLFRDASKQHYGILRTVSSVYPPVQGRLHTRYSPIRRSPSSSIATQYAAPRLACVMPTASVHPEPGSNSPLYKFLFLLYFRTPLWVSFSQKNVLSLYTTKKCLSWPFHQLHWQGFLFSLHVLTSFPRSNLTRYFRFCILFSVFYSNELFSSHVPTLSKCFPRFESAKLLTLYIPAKFFYNFFYFNIFRWNYPTLS